MILGAIEAGGTKFICALGDGNGKVTEKVSFPTTTPEETMKKVFEFFDGKEFDALGIGSFGPIDLDKNSSTYGFITTTPKPHWGGFDLLGSLKRRYDVPMEFDTDVNGAALAEATWGAAKGIDSCVYFTIGTGVGGGALVNGELVHGLLHPEMGHFLVAPHKDDTYKGKCPFHGNCLEGMAAGPAIEERWGIKGQDLPEDHPAWDLEAYYLAQGVMTTIVTLSPKKIILGGGVMKQKQLFPKIHKNVKELLNGYVAKKEITDNIEDYIVFPDLGDNAGICGALALAKKAL